MTKIYFVFKINVDVSACYTQLFMVICFQNAHIALIDSLMIAFISETVSVEKIVQAVR